MSIVVVGPLFAIIEIKWTLFGELLDGFTVQPGFGLVAVCYIWWRDNYNPLDRIQMSSVEGVAWIGLIPIGYERAVQAVTPVLPTLGLSHGAHGGTVKWCVFFDGGYLTRAGGHVRCHGTHGRDSGQRGSPRCA